MESNEQRSASPLMAALEKFEAAEANLVKLEQLSNELGTLVPGGISFGSNPEYEDRSRAYALLLAALPKIDGWRPSAEPPELNAQLLPRPAGRRCVLGEVACCRLTPAGPAAARDAESSA
jgi:hypothetical protein